MNKWLLGALTIGSVIVAVKAKREKDNLTGQVEALQKELAISQSTSMRLAHLNAKMRYGF